MEPVDHQARSGAIGRLTDGIGRAARSVRFLMVASGVAFIIVVNMFIAYGIWVQRHDALVRLEDANDALAAMAEARAERAFDEIDRLSRGWTWPMGAAAGVALREIADIPGVAAVAVRDADGRITHRIGVFPTRDGGSPPLVRPLTDAGGRELGSLEIALDPAGLSGVALRASTMAGITVALRRDRTDDSEAASIAGADGRIVGRARVPGRPYTVEVARDIGPALADWRRDAMAWSAIGLAMSAAIGVLTWFVVRQLERRDAAQAELLEASRRIRRILDSMVDAVITIDGRGRILTFNPAAERMFGFPEEDVAGRSVNLLVPADSHHHHHRIDPSARARGPLIIGLDREAIALRRDGTTFPMTLAVSALTQPRPENAGGETAPDDTEKRIYVGVIRDITQRKRYEAEIIAARNQAESASRIKTEFLANMSHELRTPLNAIIGFSEILASQYFGTLNERQMNCARDIHDSGAHLLDIVNAVLDMSRLETGHFELIEEVADVGEVVAQALAMVRDRADENGLTLVNDARNVLPRVEVDPRAFKRVLLNLLSNAVKFTPRGGTVTVAAAADDAGGLAVSVADTGIGIPADALELIFDPFRQGNGASNREYEGTGLGLSIARNLLALHGGTLTCRSVEREGTTMTARLPPERVLGDRRAAPSNQTAAPPFPTAGG